MFWNKKNFDFIELSVGKVYIKPITHGILNFVEKNSIVYGDKINNALYFQLMEKQIVCLSKRKYDNLSLMDGTQLRNKIKEILKRDGLINDKVILKEDKVDIFSNEEIEWFDKSKKESLNNLKSNILPKRMFK